MKLKFKKHYIRQHSFEKERYNRDKQIIVKYGLRNKKEIGKYLFLLKKYRSIQVQKDEGTITLTNYNKVIDKLTKNEILQEGKNILDLTIEDFLQRRLQTIVYELGFGKTLLHARQLITHKHINVNGEVCIRPSRIINKKDLIVSRDNLGE